MVGAHVVAAAILAIVIGTMGCRDSSDPDRPPASVTTTDSPRPSEPPSILIFPTQLPDSAGANALLRGLLIEEDGCLKVISEHDGTTYPIIWPHGFGWSDDDGVVTVHDAEETTVGRVSETITMSGGEGSGNDLEGCLRASKAWFAFFTTDLQP